MKLRDIKTTPEWLAFFSEISADEYLDLCKVKRRPWIMGRKKYTRKVKRS
jgi:hypothetical protein